MTRTRDPAPQATGAGSGGRGAAWSGVVLIALAAWLAWPDALPRAWSEGGARGPLVLLVDASARATLRRPGLARRVADVARELGAEARRERRAAALVLVAADVRRALGPGPAEELAALGAEDVGRWLSDVRAGGGDGATEVERALGLVEPWVLDARLGRPGRVVLLGDGRYTGADPRPRLARWAAAGVALELRALDPPTLPDLAVARVELPPTVEPGAPLAARVDLRWDPGASPAPPAGELRLEVEDAAGVRRWARPLAAPPGSGPVSWSERFELGPAARGRTRVSVTARAGADPVVSNDTATADAEAGGVLRVLVVVPAPVGSTAGARERAVAWLGDELPGVELVTAEPDAWPAELPGADVLVTLDVRPSEMHPSVESFVLAGGGWLVAGGWSLAEGAAAATEGEGAWPLVPLVPRAAERPPRDVALLVDASGSMAGEPFDLARRAALVLASAVPADDGLELAFFTDRVGERHGLRDGVGEAPGAAVERAFAAARPRGPTDVVAAVESWVAGRDATRDALLLVLTDGRTEPPAAAGGPPGDPGGRTAPTAERVELRLVAVGRDADRATLRALLPPGAALLEARDLGDVDELMRREVLEDGLVAGGATPRVPAGTTGAAALLSDELGAALAAQGAPWARAVATVPRAEADVLLLGPDGSPLLALGRVGLGRVAAWPTSPAPGWAAAWASRVDLWGPLLRSLGRERGERPVLRARDGRLELAGLGPEWPAVVPAEVGDGRGNTARLELVPPRAPPGVDPRGVREAPLPAALARVVDGPLDVRLELEEPPPGAATRWVLAPGSRADDDAVELGPLPEAGESDAVSGARAGAAAAPWVLAAGLGLLLVDLALAGARRRP